jgi:hypothetical protein
LVAQYFHTIVNAFFDCFFKSLAKGAGIFGTVSSHFGVVESTTRMMMHLHRFAWLTGNFGAANLSKRLVADPDFKDRIIGYIQSIVRETVDLTDGQRYGRALAPGSVVFDMPPGMTPTEFQSALDKDSNDITARVQMHKHSVTCTKYKRFSRVPRVGLCAQLMRRTSNKRMSRFFCRLSSVQGLYLMFVVSSFPGLLF